MKNRVGSSVALLVGISCLAMLLPAWARGLDRSVTPDLLQSRIAAAQNSSELDEARKTRLIDLYRQALGNLEAARANRDAADEFRRALRDAPEEAEKVRQKIERRVGADPTGNLQISASATSDDLARKLDEEIATWRPSRQSWRFWRPGSGPRRTGPRRSATRSPPRDLKQRGWRAS